MTAAADLLFHRRKRHLADSLHPRHFHGPQRHRRFRPLAFRLPFLGPPPEARSTAFDMGNFLSGFLGWRPRDDGLGVYRKWVDASGDLTVAIRDDVEIRYEVVGRRVGDPRKAALEAAAPPREKKKPYYTEAFERTRRYVPRLDKLGVEVRLTEEKLAELRKSAEAPKDDLSELFIPLTAEEENEVHDCLYGSGSSSKVLVLHESSNIEVSREKFRCLRPGGWLNDEVINLYLELLKEREIREPKRFLRCHFFNTFFYKKLACGKNGYDYKSVKRWTTRRKLGYELIECDKARYIAEEVKDKSNKEIDISSWQKELVDYIPLQQNGWDCGMFMLKYIDFHSRGLGLSFSQDNMEYFRKRTVKEILRLRAD